MGRAGPDAPPAHRVFHRHQRGAVDHLGEGTAALCAGGPVIECTAPADPDDQRRRDPDLWTVHCRDGHGRRARLLVHLSAAGVCLTVPEHGPLQLSAWQVGQLRAALRDAFLSLARLAGPDGLAERATPTAPPPARPPSPRQRVPLLIPARPSVSEIATRLTNP